MTIYNTFKEYIWLVNTIYQAKTISLAEINKRWVMTDMSEGIAFSRSTFYRHKAAIEDIFGILWRYKEILTTVTIRMRLQRKQTRTHANVLKPNHLLGRMLPIERL